MRQFRKIFLMVGGILAALGIIFIIAGIAMGGSHVILEDGLSGRLSYGFDSDFFVDDGDTENMNYLEGDETVLSKDEVNSITLNGKYGEYEINIWDNDTYVIQGIKGADRIRYSVENGVLKISMTGKNIVYRGIDVKVKIYVPKDVTLNSVTLNIGAGTIICNNIKAQTMDVNIGAGEGEINNIEVADSKFRVGAGDGEIKNSRLTNCDVKVGMGDFDVEGTISGNVDVDCGVGNVEMNLSNLYSDFNYTVKVGAGDVEIGDREYSGISNSVSLNNGSDKTMNIKCGLGDVSVELSN